MSVSLSSLSIATVIDDLRSNMSARRKTIDRYVSLEERIQKTLKALQVQGGFVDEHNGKWRDARDFAVYVYTDAKSNEQTSVVVPLEADAWFCINPLILDEHTGKVHLSRFSVGGVVQGNDLRSLTERLRSFNQQQENSLLTMSGTFLVHYTFSKTQRVERILI